MFERWTGSGKGELMEKAGEGYLNVVTCLNLLLDNPGCDLTATVQSVIMTTETVSSHHKVQDFYI